MCPGFADSDAKDGLPVNSEPSSDKPFRLPARKLSEDFRNPVFVKDGAWVSGSPKNVVRINAGGVVIASAKALRVSTCGAHVATESAAIVSAFSQHVPGVFAHRAGSQVAGIYAARVVAGVHDDQSFRDRTDIDLVGDAMGEDIWKCSAASDLAVALVVVLSRPRPASIRIANDNLGPEALFERGELRHGCTVGQVSSGSNRRV